MNHANPLDAIMGVHEAAEKWGTTANYVKRLCMMEKVHAKKFGKTWVIVKEQPNPKKRERK